MPGHPEHLSTFKVYTLCLSGLKGAGWTRKVIPARELVPGDIIGLRIGDIAPADVKLMGDGQLTLDESAHTELVWAYFPAWMFANDTVRLAALKLARGL